MNRAFGTTLGLLAGIIGLAACDVDQTEEGEMPEMNVEVEEGNLPEYDVETADVEVGTEKDTVVIEKPTVDVDMPDEDEGGEGSARPS